MSSVIGRDIQLQTKYRRPGTLKDIERSYFPNLQGSQVIGHELDGGVVAVGGVNGEAGEQQLRRPSKCVLTLAVDDPTQTKFPQPQCAALFLAKLIGRIDPFSGRAFHIAGVVKSMTDNVVGHAHDLEGVGKKAASVVPVDLVRHVDGIAKISPRVRQRIGRRW